jgi:hypothetical protein
MERPNADPAVLQGELGTQVAPPSGTIEPRGNVVTDESDLDELVGYQPVPPRQSHTVLIRLRQGGRLRLLPYPRDEEDS